MSLIVICVPSPFPYKSNMVVPWNYDVTVNVDGEKGNWKGESLVISKPNITSITKTNGVTCSGRVFAPEKMKRMNDELTKGLLKGNERSNFNKGKIPLIRLYPTMRRWNFWISSRKVIIRWLINWTKPLQRYLPFTPKLWGSSRGNDESIEWSPCHQRHKYGSLWWSGC